ncbi:Autophagy-related protein 29 [Penicillium digitatum PHI26]|uniref:Autophagy-related protein 29 n=2 Tax=Penicillium digitatum TaxID=36651 RepID=K9H1L1_PEND2|nr:Autophagy-related protein 29 [Penicillium digitatum Pd1]EKV19011.1 Autophagy-related protein 29 [Penicillium digitatum PHI26]EKV21149.1 Autophagy-related protein 29 [Penicillium digitatum Pd1]
MSTKINAMDTNFTVFIRLPFPRGDFVDPPPASLPKRNPLNIH